MQSTAAAVEIVDLQDVLSDELQMQQDVAHLGCRHLSGIRKLNVYSSLHASTTHIIAQYLMPLGSNFTDHRGGYN